jgi:hypothetical protein
MNFVEKKVIVAILVLVRLEGSDNGNNNCGSNCNKHDDKEAMVACL